MLLIAAIALNACKQEASSELETYRQRRDSLRLEMDKLQKNLIAVEKKISELDTIGEARLVTLFRPEHDTFRHFFEVYGNVESDRMATLYPESQGIIQAIQVREGEQVRRGQLIARLDDDLLRSNLAELETSLSLANTLYEKQERLWDQKIGSEVQYLEAKNRKESLEKSISTLKEQINKTSVRAPFDGVVDKIFPKEGEMASMQSPLARIVNRSALYVRADVTERYMGRVNQGDEVEVIVNRRDTLKAEIGRVGKFINPANRSFEVRVELGETDVPLMPNSLVVLKINDFTADSAIAIPSSLIMQDGRGEDYVFLAKANGANGHKAEKRNIRTGMRYLGQTLVLDGLDAEHAIIDKGSRSVRDGDPIKEATL